MSAFLFATTPAAGHTLPALPIARALIERGHAVRWYAGVAFADRITDIDGNPPADEHLRLQPDRAGQLLPRTRSASAAWPRSDWTS